jgi:hypothetical protein
MDSKSAPLIQGGTSEAAGPEEAAAIMPVKDPHTRTRPLTLASGHGRYITVTREWLVSVGGMAVTCQSLSLKGDP